MEPHPTPEPEKPNYYAIIPAPVRYDTNLSPAAKIMYGEITALSQSTGKCFASNSYFVKLYELKSDSTVSRWIKELVERGHITSELIYKPGTREIIRRELQICGGGIGKNAMGGIGKNAMDNNTSMNNTSINKSLSDFSEKSFELITAESIINESFEKFWLLYSKKIDRENCFRKWKKLSRLDHEAILTHVPRYVASTPDKSFRKNPLTYLNTLAWLNEIIVPKKTDEPRRAKRETLK